jgi:hypothetical protein
VTPLPTHGTSFRIQLLLGAKLNLPGPGKQNLSDLTLRADSSRVPARAANPEPDQWTSDELIFACMELGREFISTPHDQIVSAVKVSAARLSPNVGRVTLTLTARKLLGDQSRRREMDRWFDGWLAREADLVSGSDARRPRPANRVLIP